MEKQWNNAKTIAIRVPEIFAQKLLDLAYQWDTPDNNEFDFLIENYPSGGEVQANEIYSQYIEWAKPKNIPIISATAFGLKLKNYYGFTRKRKTKGNYYLIPPLKK